MSNTSPILRGVSVALLAIVSSSGIASAQQPSMRRWEIRPFTAAFVPTGSQSNTLKSGLSAGILGAYSFNQYLSAVGTFAWSSSEDKAALANEDVNVYQYDIGAEAGINKQLTSSLTLRPFLGLGMGGRAYDYNDRNSEAQYNVAGYGAGGAELMRGRFGWRVEVRDYVSGFKGLNGELDSRRTRNDLQISSGMAVHF